MKRTRPRTRHDLARLLGALLILGTGIPAVVAFGAPAIAGPESAWPVPTANARETGAGAGRRAAAPRPGPQAADPRLQQARGHLQRGELDRARTILQGVLDDAPDHSEAHLLLGRVALAAGDLEAAEEHLLTARDHSPRFPFMVEHGLGMLRLVSREFGRAREHLSRSIELAPRFAAARLARARAALFDGDVEAATADLRAVLEGAPRAAPRAAILLGELRLLEGRSAEAAELFRSVTEGSDPSTGPAAARMYLSTLRDARAESAPPARAWLGRNLNDAHAYFWLGLVEEARGRNDLPRRLFRTALAIDDQHAPSYLAWRRTAPAEAAGDGESTTTGETRTALPAPYPHLSHRMERARRALEGGDVTEAESIAREILEVRPLFVPARLLLVQAAEARDDPLGALVVYERLFDQLPDLPDPLVHRATLARRVGALELAEDSLRAAMRYRSDEASLHYLLGSILAEAGESEGAIEALRRAEELGFESASLYVTLGNLLHERMEIAAAVDAMRRAVELDPGAAEHIASFALTALTAEHTATVRGILEEHVADHPDDANSLYALGSLYLREGELDAAERIFERLKELRPDGPQIHYNLALVHRRRGRQDAADREMAEFRRLKRQERRRWETHNRAFRLRQRANDALASDDLDTAVELLRRLVDGDAAEPGDLVTLGRVHLRRGEPGTALEALRRALRSLPHDAEALCAAASAAARLGNAEEAARLRRRAEVLLGRPCGEGTDAPPEDPSK